MSQELLALNEKQKDALKEIGNIGAGNAATAFAQFLDSKIEMTVPAVELVPVTRVTEITGNEEQKLAGILLRVMGQAPSNILLAITEKSIKHLLNMILNKDIEVNNLGEVERSALKEVGNILTGAYLTSINRITNLNLIQSVPGFAYDMAGAILSSSFVSSAQTSDHVLLIETRFISEGYEIEAYLFLIPETGSLTKILSSLGFDQE
ncbi:MAG: chemotaxis protein CheC [Halanaerobiaceae bacterium]